MGEVYLAHDTKLDRLVALKILPTEEASDRKRMQRFIQEAQAASSLNYPNIFTIYEFDETDSTQFIVTEFIDGETLRHRISRTSLSIAESLEIAIQLASLRAVLSESAFAAAYQQGRKLKLDEAVALALGEIA